MKRKYGLCPEPRAFAKWYRGRVSRNLDELAEQGKSLRVFGFGVTEEQVNSKFKLMGEFKRGDILKKLQECSFPVIDKRVPGDENGPITLAIKPRDVTRLRRDGNSPTAEHSVPIGGEHEH